MAQTHQKVGENHNKSVDLGCKHSLLESILKNSEIIFVIDLSKILNLSQSLLVRGARHSSWRTVGHPLSCVLIILVLRIVSKINLACLGLRSPEIEVAVLRLVVDDPAPPDLR